MSVSVVIPAYNSERFLGRAVQSALTQTLAPLEIIVVDDGSTDGTSEVARGFGGIVRCISQENAGPAAARNHGVREARGEFIAFLDADDWWYPHHLEEAARILAAHPELQWYCAAFEERMRDGRTRRRAYSGPLLKEDAYIADYFKSQAQHWFACTITMVVRKQVLMEIGGCDEGMYGSEEAGPYRSSSDTDLRFRIALRYPQIGYSRRVGSVYWRHGESVTARCENHSSERRLRFIQRWERLAAQAGPAAARRSEPLVRLRFHTLIRHAIREDDRDVLAHVRTTYWRRLKPVDKLLLLVFRVVSSETIRKVDDAVIALKRCLRRWLSRIRPAGRRPSPVQRADPSPGGDLPPPGARG